MRKLSFLMLFLFPLLAFSQAPYSWEIGGSVNVTSYQGDLHTPKVNLGRYNDRLAGAFHVRRNLGNSFALRLNLLVGQLAGDDNSFDDPEWRKRRGISYTSPLFEGALLAEIYPFGVFKSAISEGSTKSRRFLSPYLLIGVGGAYTNPTVDWNDANGNEEIDPLLAQEDKNAKTNNINIVVPFGAGVRFALNDRATIGLEASLRPTFTDYVDGVSKAGNPEENDWYFVGGLSFSYALGQKTSAPKKVNTSPAPTDSDGDGVLDVADKCPDWVGKPSLMGCPDSDNDGITDADDNCPDLAGKSVFKGCPDTDNDGISDRDDRCPNAFGTPALLGCPDADSDGTPDIDDTCPTEKGAIAAKGCPDRDADGVADKDDACPDGRGSIAHKGCPDTDGDGVYDNEDRCIEKAGPAANKGCPEIKAEDKAKLDRAVKLVQFETGKAALLKKSYTILDEVAAVMNQYPEYSLVVSGHTDSSGDDAKNQSLSEQRAESCYNYLLNKGISSYRMMHGGYGETQPIADNSTSEGRAKNRRVEFSLIIK